MKAVIATTKTPTDFELFLELVRDVAQANNVAIQGYSIVAGLTCANHGLLIDGTNDACEDFLNLLARALMPARWSRVLDDDLGVVLGQFGFTQ
jgi:hypothetical protein